MKSIKSMLSVLLLAGTLGWGIAPVWGAGVVSPEGGVLKVVAIPGSNYCHLRFPPIREDTLYWDRPVLEDASTVGLIDFYGPCDHDPLGKDEIRTQRREYKSDLNEENDSDND